MQNVSKSVQIKKQTHPHLDLRVGKCSWTIPKSNFVMVCLYLAAAHPIGIQPICFPMKLLLHWILIFYGANVWKKRRHHVIIICADRSFIPEHSARVLIELEHSKITLASHKGQLPPLSSLGTPPRQILRSFITPLSPQIGYGVNVTWLRPRSSNAENFV